MKHDDRTRERFDGAPWERRKEHMTKQVIYFTLLAITTVFLTGCYMTLEERWQAFDAERRQRLPCKDQGLLSSPSGEIHRSAYGLKTERTHGYGLPGMAALKGGERR